MASILSRDPLLATLNGANDDNSDFEGFDNHGVDAVEKDSDEEDLERAVFGDAQGFQHEIDDYWANASGRRDIHETLSPPATEDEGDGEEDLEGVADDALFFVDAGPTSATGQAVVPAPTSDDSDDDSLDILGPTAWEDSDDERITVSLASVPRLRKLRKMEDEDVIGGKDYIRRLRRQYERLHPTPPWVKDAYELRPGSKRRRDISDDEDEDMSDAEQGLAPDENEEVRVQSLDQLLRNSRSLARSANESPRKRRKLQPEVLDIQRLKDIPGSQKSFVTALSVHPTLPLLLSSGPASTVYLHHLQPTNSTTPNPLLTSLLIKRTPISTAAFSPDSDDPRIFLSGPNRYFHAWDLNSGIVAKTTRVYGNADSQRTFETFRLSPDGAHIAFKGVGKKGSGALNVLDASTMQWVGQARIESKGGIVDFQWWRNGEGLCIIGSGGEVNEWSLSEQRVVARWQDEGAVGSTVLALGGRSRDGLGGSRWVAIGSSSGILNIYDRSAWAPPSNGIESEPLSSFANAGIPTRPKPTKVLDQLTTLITHVAISPDGQLLCMASGWKKDALRLVHLPSCTVYRNWPTSSTPLGKVSSIAWARPDIVGDDAAQSGTVAVLIVGSEAGRIKLWEVKA